MGKPVKDPYCNLFVLENLPENLKAEPCIFGIDEAGRGPLVYCLFVVPAKDHLLLRERFQAKDSKDMTPESRFRFSNLIFENHPTNYGWLIGMLSPRKITEGMLRIPKYNLNEMSYDCIFDLLGTAFKFFQNVEHVSFTYLDLP